MSTTVQPEATGGAGEGAAGSLRGDDAAYPGYRRLGVRLTEPLDPLLTTAARPAGVSPAAAVHRFDEAQLVMLSEQGVIPRDHAARCLRTLLEMEAEGLEEARAATRAGNHAGEVYLVRHLGMEVGGSIHAGRS